MFASLTEDRQIKCDELHSIHLQCWVACGLWHHYCPFHLEAPGMMWVDECRSPYPIRVQFASVCASLCMCGRLS